MCLDMHPIQVCTDYQQGMNARCILSVYLDNCVCMFCQHVGRQCNRLLQLTLQCWPDICAAAAAAESALLHVHVSWTFFHICECGSAASALSSVSRLHLRC